MAVDLVGIQTLEHLNRIFQLSNHDFTVSANFKNAVSSLKRNGHARFRRGPPSSPSDPHLPSISSQSEEKLASKDCSLKKPGTDTTASFRSTSSLNKHVTDATALLRSKTLLEKSVTDATASFRSTSSSLVSSVAGGSVEGSVSNGKQLCSLGIVAPAPLFSSRKPPLPSSHRKRCSTDRMQGSEKTCHCCKRRRTRSKREIRRVPIVGSKVESIPADDYSWKKYGKKKVDGSPYPRVYYKCSSAKGCPARKRVELALNDSRMLLVTYDGEHRHRHAPTPLPTSQGDSGSYD